jgi:hypothetical protein
LGAIIIFALVFSSCKPEEPVIPNEEELITTLTYTLTPLNGGTPTVFSFTDPDGDGGNPPIFSIQPLEANTTYTGQIQLESQSGGISTDITPEIKAEAVDHQFFFVPSQGLGLSVAYADADTNQHPIGLATTLTTGSAGQGTLKVILRHEPGKNAPGVADGDIDLAGGETDIEVSFEVTIQ